MTYTVSGGALNSDYSLKIVCFSFLFSLLMTAWAKIKMNIYEGRSKSFAIQYNRLNLDKL